MKFNAGYGKNDDTNRRKHFLNLLLQQCDKEDPVGSLKRTLDMVMMGLSAKVSSMITFRRMYMS